MINTGDHSLLFADVVVHDLLHHTINSLHHLLAITLKASLEAAVVEYLSDYHTCVVCILFPEFIEFDDDGVLGVIFEGEVLKAHRWQSRLSNGIFVPCCVLPSSAS